jgi:large subunit ribosomal protein L21
MKFAIIKSGGKQYRVFEKDRLKIEKVDVKKGNKITFTDVLLVSDMKKVNIGRPHVKGVKIEARIVDHGKGKKIKILKFKPKKRYKRLRGHRQNYSEIEIGKIKV